MRAEKLKLVLFIFLFNFVRGQDESLSENEEKLVKVCSYCTCSEIPNEDNTHLVLNIQCSELDKIQHLTDLDKIVWPENPNGLEITATFEGLGLITLGKLPPNSKLEALRLSNNAIKTYWPDTFADVPNLKKISLSQNDISEITPDLFTNIYQLEELDISYNKLSGFNPLDFKTLKHLKRLNLQSNLLKKIPSEAILPMDSLEDLDLSKNGIYDLLLQKSTSDAFKNLKRLSLSGNRIRSVLIESFPEDNSLEFLDLSNNIIEIVEENSFVNCKYLRELNLAQNNITMIFALPPSLQIVILKQNTIHRWLDFPEGITYVDLSYNRLTDLYKAGSMNFSNLELFNIAGNQLKEVAITEKLPKLFSLDLSYNSLEDVPTCVSTEIFPNLEELRLDGNPMKTVYFKNILTVRSLSLNEMSDLIEVEDKAFSNVMGRSVEGSLDSKICFSLFMSNCRSLRSIHEGAFQGTTLCMLDISSNNLTHLSKNLLDWSLVSEGVNLQWNPWDCSCHLQWVLDELLPALYNTHSRLLTQLRCETPKSVQGLRLVHWYNWTERVLCSDAFRSDTGSYLVEAATKDVRESLPQISSLTLILGGCILLALIVVIGLTVYLVRTRKRYNIRQAALKRKRQSAMDARNSNIGPEKEQYSALNKV